MSLTDILLILTGLPAGLLAAWLAGKWSAYAPGLGRTRWLGRVSGAAGVLIALSAYIFAPPGTFLLSCLLGWTLLALAVADLKHFILPDPLNLIAASLGLIMIALFHPYAWADHLIGGLAGYLVLFVVETTYRLLRGREGLGRGDAKLLGALGLWVGWTRLPDILLLASASGLVFVLIANLTRGGTRAQPSAIAFGPWLALAGWIAWLSGPLLVPAI